LVAGLRGPAGQEAAASGKAPDQVWGSQGGSPLAALSHSAVAGRDWAARSLVTMIPSIQRKRAYSSRNRSTGKPYEAFEPRKEASLSGRLLRPDTERPGNAGGVGFQNLSSLASQNLSPVSSAARAARRCAGESRERNGRPGSDRTGLRARGRPFPGAPSPLWLRAWVGLSVSEMTEDEGWR
jgi:hypothetical protein